jgi:hypothetical protein
MPSASEILNKVVKTASNASSAPRKHKKKLRQGAAASVTLTEPTTARTGPRETETPSSGHSANGDSDVDDPVSLLANFQQGRLSDKVRAERHKNQIIVDPEPSSHQDRPESQSRTDQDTIDQSSSEVPHSKRAARPNQTGGRHPEPGSRCDTCIIQRRGCDGVRPVCGRCTLVSRKCEWHEEPISRKGLEDLRRKEAFGGAMRMPTKRVHDEMIESYPIEIRPATAASWDEEEIIDRRACRARREDQIAILKAREDALRTVTQLSNPSQGQADRPTILDAAALEQGINRWTYEDHLEMLETISQPRVGPATKEEVFGHGKGNRIFDDTTKTFEDFDNLDDLDENVPQMEMDNAPKLNWEESEILEISTVVPNAALTHRGEWIPSSLRKRIGLSEYPMPSVEVPEVQERTARARMQRQPYKDHVHLANLGRDEFRWMDDWLEEPRRHTEDWDDGGRLPRPDEAPNFSWCDNMLD